MKMKRSGKLKVPGGRADDAPFPVDEALVDLVGIKAPAGGEEMDLVGVVGNGLGGDEGGGLRRFRVSAAFHCQFVFGGCGFALVPKGFTGPGVGADDAAGLDLDPGMVIQDGVGAEELDMAELAAEVQEKTKARVHVIVRIRQGRADDENPTGHGWRDE